MTPLDGIREALERLHDLTDREVGALPPELARTHGYAATRRLFLFDAVMIWSDELDAFSSNPVHIQALVDELARLADALTHEPKANEDRLALLRTRLSTGVS